jgi:hypothetical protein
LTPSDHRICKITGSAAGERFDLTGPYKEAPAEAALAFTPEDLARLRPQGPVYDRLLGRHRASWPPGCRGFPVAKANHPKDLARRVRALLGLSTAREPTQEDTALGTSRPSDRPRKGVVLQCRACQNCLIKMAASGLTCSCRRLAHQVGDPETTERLLAGSEIRAKTTPAATIVAPFCIRKAVCEPWASRLETTSLWLRSGRIASFRKASFGSRQLNQIRP